MSLISPIDPARLHTLAEQVLRAQRGAGHELHVAAIPSNCTCTAQVLVHQPGVLCGLDAAAAVFEAIDPTLGFEPFAWDSAPVTDLPAMVAEISGLAASLLIGQRAGLELIARLSGIATHTHRYVEAVSHTSAWILDPHTAPGTFESYAIECGGGYTRLPDQADPVLITAAHIQLAGGTGAAIERARNRLPAELPMQVEVSTLDDARGAFAAEADALLLRNMHVEDIRWIVNHAPPHTWLHAIGDITPSTVGPIALAGVHAITPYELTGSAAALDTSLTLTSFA